MKITSYKISVNMVSVLEKYNTQNFVGRKLFGKFGKLQEIHQHFLAQTFPF